MFFSKSIEVLAWKWTWRIKGIQSKWNSTCQYILMSLDMTWQHLEGVDISDGVIGQFVLKRCLINYEFITVFLETSSS